LPIDQRRPTITVAPDVLRELAATVRQVAGVLEQTVAVLPAARHAGAAAPDPVPRALELLTADARAALTAEAGALHDVATALTDAADSYVSDDGRIAAALRTGTNNPTRSR
jgi:hypothetical protein